MFQNSISREERGIDEKMEKKLLNILLLSFINEFQGSRNLRKLTDRSVPRGMRTPLTEPATKQYPARSLYFPRDLTTVVNHFWGVNYRSFTAKESPIPRCFRSANEPVSVAISVQSLRWFACRRTEEDADDSTLMTTQHPLDLNCESGTNQLFF